MTSEVKKLVRALRSYAREYKDGTTLGRAIINTENIMFAAADTLVRLSEIAEKASARAAMCDTAMEAAANAQRERDDCTMRMQAAENDLRMRRCCFACKHYYEQREECESCFDDKASRADGTWMANWVWRGPCAENGGVKDE